jgi:hypothetical protein
MYWRAIRFLSIALLSMLLLALPALVAASAEQLNAGPPIGQTLVREGDLAVRLETALGLGNSRDEIAAEDRLTEVGIAPLNGWIADYPVTPDIVGELYKAVRDAAAADKVPMGVETALQRVHDVMTQAGLAVETQTSGRAYGAEPAGSPSAPSSTEVNNYYYNQGPPTVTYYAPPPDYYYMYGWVPYPFWCAGFWFSGFFILHDFHRPVFIDNRVVIVSNHFTDVRTHRIFRVDPVARLNGSTIAGTRVITNRGVVPTGVRRENPSINTPTVRPLPANTTRIHAPRSGAVFGTPRSSAPAGLPASRGGNFNRPMRDNRTMSTPAQGAGVVGSLPARAIVSGAPSRAGGAVAVHRGERTAVPSVIRNEGFSTQFRGDRMMGSASRGGGFERMATPGGGGFGGRGRR